MRIKLKLYAICEALKVSNAYEQPACPLAISKRCQAKLSQQSSGPYIRLSRRLQPTPILID